MEDLPSELRRREWMRRIEAVLFASVSSVAQEDRLNEPNLHIASPRLRRCRCGAAGTGTFSSLSDPFYAHVAPKMLCLEAKRASPVSFDATVGLLKDVLPVGATLNAETVRNHVRQVANRM